MDEIDREYRSLVRRGWVAIGVGLAAFVIYMTFASMGHGQTATGGSSSGSASRESLAIQALQQQRNGALDSVVGCVADSEARRNEMTAQIDALNKRIEEMTKKKE